MILYTIGFTKKSAQKFFELLEAHHVECMIDIRLRPDGQLSGFAQKRDLPYFLKRLLNCDYVHLPSLAPSEEILKAYRKDKNWARYEQAFLSLMGERGIPYTLDRSLFEEKICCLLCSEPTPERCHRRLVAERIASTWEDVKIIHL
jgi:uncharacterized protein (DUF488 family)